MTDTLQSLAKAQEKLNETFKKHGENLIKEEFNKFFKKHPEVVAVRWTQSVPYFNDGDACEFRLNEIYVAFSDEFEKLLKLDDADSEFDDDEFCFHSYYVLNGPIEKEFGKIADCLYSIQSHLENIFGSPAKITVTPEFMNVEEYDHD